MKNITFFTLSILCFFLSITLSFGGPPAVSLTPTNISCFGGRNGVVNSSASGGTTPYTYLWSNGATTQNITGLAAGYYKVTVTDGASATVAADVTLTEPTQLTGSLTPSVYYSVNNISCSSCCNGTINASVSGGTSSYSYSWTSTYTGFSSQTTANISSLCKGVYTLVVTDAHGCTTSKEQTMTEPDKNSWDMVGNSGSNPSTAFIGNSDSVDLVLRTHNIERMRIKGNGDLKINSVSGTGYELLMTDSNGIIKRMDKQIAPTLNPWTTTGNNIVSTNFIGTINTFPFIIRTDNVEKMRIATDGKVLIGTSTGDMKFNVAHDDANGGMALNRLSTSTGKSEIRFEQAGSEKWAIGTDMQSNGTQTFFIWDHVGNATRFMINQYGKVGIGVDPPATNATAYLLYVAGGIMTRDVKVTSYAFADYVFNTDYKLMGIYELEQFIKQNKHLPEIPSAKDIEKNEGFEVGDMQVKLLKKIEEQSLYIIEQQKQIDELKSRMKNLERRK